MIYSGVLDLRKFGDVLGATIPRLRWRLHGNTLRADLPNPKIRIAVGQSGNFGRAICDGFPSAAPLGLLELSSALHGPARFTQTLSKMYRLESSWPLTLEPFGQAEIFSSDLCRLLVDNARAEPSLEPINTDVKQRLKSVVAWQDGYTEVPGSVDGKRVDFITGKSRSKTQFSYRQHSKTIMSISTLVTNWRVLC